MRLLAYFLLTYLITWSVWFASHASRMTWSSQRDSA
jgi:hypothetical protein